MSARKAPYCIGVNGHANICDCTACAYARAVKVEHLAMRDRLGGHLHSSRTVYVESYVVRAHFRRGRNHLNAYPNTLKAVQKAISSALIRRK